MKNISEIKSRIDSARNVAELPSTRTETVPEEVHNSDRHSGAGSCVNENSETDVNEKCSRNEYNLEQDIEKLIEVSKQFQTDYENEKVRSDAASDEYLCLSILNSNSLRKQKHSASDVVLPVNDRDNFYFSNSSSRKENIFHRNSNPPNKSFTPIIPHPGPFGTGIIRPLPKKHSCVPRKDTASTAKQSRFGWSVKPYASRYYNFDRTHPGLKLVESGGSMIPKRISKETTEFIAKAKSPVVTTKSLLNDGLTWHEFFERCNVYSAKSFQSSFGDARTTVTEAVVSELLTSESTDHSKIQKHILPQLNIRAECCVQRIPDISIAPCGFQRTRNTNIKLVQIIYEESDSRVETVETQSMESVEQAEQKTTEPLHRSPESPASKNLEVVNVDESVESNETKTSVTCSSTTPSQNNGYDSSLEESISLNVSQASALTSGFADRKMKARSSKDVGIQTQKLVTTEALRKERVEEARTKPVTRWCSEGAVISASGDSRLHKYNTEYLPQEEYQQIKLPTFPTHELVQMVDEIFDTSSDAANVSYKYVVKETSVQTDIVWENITDLFKQQSKPNVQPRTDAEVTESFIHPNATFVKQPETGGGTVPANVVKESEKIIDQHSLQAMRQVEGQVCRHSRLKKIKICSCLACKSNICFSSVNIDQSIQRTSHDSSSSPVFNSRPIPSVKVNLFPSERYKLMKQAQRDHFENDPRISRTLRKIYATARKNEFQRETTSSSSSDHYRPLKVPLCHISTSDDEPLGPDLFTFNDEILLFGLQSHDDIQYSSDLLKTQSSQDTSASIGKYYAAGFRKNLFCTNSEESSCNSVHGQRVSELEQCLLKDIENSGSDPSSALNSLFSTSSLERKISEIQL